MKHISKEASSNQLFEALQQNLLQSTKSLSTTSSAATATTISTRPSMTTTQLAMTKFGNTSATTAANPPTPGGESSSTISPHYISVQDRQRKNQQAIVNLIFSFTLVLLACQTVKTSMEKRRIQEQYDTTKQILQETQTTLQQLFFSTNSDNDYPSPEILQIATLIVGQELRNQRSETVAKKSRGWFHNPFAASKNQNNSASDLEDEVVVLFESSVRDLSNTQSQAARVTLDETEQRQQKRIANMIHGQLQLLLRDIAFDELKKETLNMQALAASSSSSSVPTAASSSDGRSFHQAKIYTEPKRRVDDDDEISLEQLLLESLQNENSESASSTTITTIMQGITTNDQTPPMIDPTPGSVKKRLFSI